jgi:hypothetical protein
MLQKKDTKMSESVSGEMKIRRNRHQKKLVCLVGAGHGHFLEAAEEDGSGFVLGDLERDPSRLFAFAPHL